MIYLHCRLDDPNSDWVGPGRIKSGRGINVLSFHDQSFSSISSIHMALTIVNGGGRCSDAGILYRRPRQTPSAQLPFRQRILSPATHRNRPLHVVRAKKLSSRTGRFDSKKRRGSTTKTDQEEEGEDGDENRTGEMDRRGEPPEDVRKIENVGIVFDDEKTMPELPGEEPDFWEGPQWDALGFFVQYLWAFGIVFALIACGIAVSTYNEGATDFKQTPAYKESVESRDLLEEPEASTPDVFETNPTEVAPSLD